MVPWLENALMMDMRFSGSDNAFLTASLKSISGACTVPPMGAVIFILSGLAPPNWRRSAADSVGFSMARIKRDFSGSNRPSRQTRLNSPLALPSST